MPATLPSLSPELLTIFIDIEGLLVQTSKVPSMYMAADGVFAQIKKPAGTYGLDKTFPDSMFRYERLPQEYQESGGTPFPAERILRNEKPLYIYFRDHLRAFLEELNSSGLCQLVVFTSMVQERADAILDCIEGVGQGDQSRPLFHGRLYREHCCWVPKPSGSSAARLLQPDLVAAAAAGRTRMWFVKDFLVALPALDPRRCIVIDNNTAGCAAHLKNAICLEQSFEWGDRVLLNLKTALLQCAAQEDVRDVCMRGDLYLAWTTFKDQQPPGPSGLNSEGDGTKCILEQPNPCGPVEEPTNNHTGREIWFGKNSGTSRCDCGMRRMPPSVVGLARKKLHFIF